MKKLSFIILIFLSFFWSFTSVNKSEASSENINKKKAVYFYQETCAHCQAVDEYFKENGIYDKYDINKVEISGAYNLNYFNEFFSAFGVPSEKRGWPAIFFDQKFLVGDKPIQENFVNEIEKANASDFPSPEIIKKYRSNAGEFSAEAASLHSHIPWLILLGAALADSVSPCILAVFVILASIIIFGNPENKKEIFVFGTFFLLAIFLTYLALGIGMFGLGKIFKLSEVLNRFLGLIIIFVGFFVLRKYWQNLKIIRRAEELLKKLISDNLKSLPETTGKLIKRIIQRMNLAVAALLIGFISSGFLFPCVNRPYGIFIDSFSGEKETFTSILLIIFYNLIFILPIIFLSGIIYWFAHTKKLEIFRRRHDRLVRVIVGVGLLFTGSYFICSNCF